MSLKDALHLVEAVFKMNKDGTLEKVKEKPSKSDPFGFVFAGHDDGAKPPKGSHSKSPKGFESGVGPSGDYKDSLFPGKEKYKPPEKWISSGGVVLGGEHDLEHVYVRKPANNYGPWSFPKGKIDKGESKEQAAVREVREEIGVVARILPDSYLGSGEGSHSITHYFLMYAVRDTGKHDAETEKVKLATFTEAMHLFAKGGNTRDIKILSKAMAKIEQIKRANAAKGR